MRVVDRKTFLGLPEGTIYCKGVQWAFESICIKGESLTNDWVYLDPSWAAGRDSGEALAILEISLQGGTSFACADAYGRDGCFNEDAVFLIYEAADLFFLKDNINKALQHTKDGEG